MPQPETLPNPEIIPPERNSEKTLAIVMIVIAFVVVIVQAVFLGISKLPALEAASWVVSVNAGLGIAAKLAWSYINSRPGKHRAMAERAIAIGQLIFAEAARLAAANGQPIPPVGPSGSIPAPNPTVAANSEKPRVVATPPIP